MKILTVSLKRNILFIILLLSLVRGSGSSISPTKNQKQKLSLTEENLTKHNNEYLTRLEIINNNNRNNTEQPISPVSPRTSVPPPTSRENELKSARMAGYMDFQTKLLLVCFSIFMLIFVLMLLIIGHFTWFADIRQKLEEEWEQELKAEEEKRTAESILDEMKNPFEKVVNEKKVADKESELLIDDRRESIDSSGCARGRCVPPHHSVLCPNNPNVPSLTDPIFKRDSDPFHLGTGSIIDPIDYRDQRSSTEWMNLESCVKISEPVPVRGNIRGFFGNFSTSNLIGVKRPMTPMTPEPTESISIENRNDRHRSLVDVELADVKGSSSSLPQLSPELKFDLSKLDMF